MVRKQGDGSTCPPPNQPALRLAAYRTLCAAKHGGRNACAVHVLDLREVG